MQEYLFFSQVFCHTSFCYYCTAARYTFWLNQISYTRALDWDCWIHMKLYLYAPAPGTSFSVLSAV